MVQKVSSFSFFKFFNSFAKDSRRHWNKDSSASEISFVETSDKGGEVRK
jgi:hypothetical protein